MPGRAPRRAVPPALAFVFLFPFLPAAVAGQGAAVQLFAPDARSRGMGRAFTAVAEGPQACWWNPGALGLLEHIVTVSPWASAQLVPSLADDVRLRSFGATGRVSGAGVGGHLTHLSYGETVATDVSGRVIGTVVPSEWMLLAGVGADAAAYAWPERREWGWGIGANFKLTHVNPAPSATGEPRHDATVWDADLGTLLCYRPPIGRLREADAPLELRAGAAIHNLLGREIHVFEDSRLRSEPLGQALRLGAAIECAWGRLPPFGHVLEGVVAIERNLPFGEFIFEEKATSHFGAEVSVLSLVAVRAGYASDPRGAIDSWSWGAGVGADLHFARWPRLGGRWDFASVPTALDRVEYSMLSGWVGF